jgi:hypothetical protein
MSSTTPPPPKHGGSGPFIIAAIVMLLLMGGLIYWKVSDDGSETAAPPPVASIPAAPVFEEPPPPPPPPVEEPVDAGVEKKPTKRVVSSTGQGCNGDCTGQASGTLRAQLGAKAAQARPCYERALRQNAHLQGRMKVGMRIGSNGSVCSANVTLNEVGDPGIATCVLQMFRSSTFAAPQGGCVDVEVPLRFEPKT